MGKTLILGVGNILLRDEGVGVYVAQRLMKLSLPPDVAVIECETELFGVMSLIEKAKKLIVIDAIKAGAHPGTVFKFRDQDICEPSKKLYSLHQIGLLDTLEILGRMDVKPITTIIGIEPKDVEVGMELSSEIEDAMPGIISQVLDEVSP